MTVPLNIGKILEVIGYQEDPALVVSFSIGVGYLELRRFDGTVRCFKILQRPDGSGTFTGEDITWAVEWAIKMGWRGGPATSGDTWTAS